MGVTRTAHGGGQAVSQALDGLRSAGCCRAYAAAIIRGKSRMSETLTYGSVRGAPGDRHPYRDPILGCRHFCHGLLFLHAHLR